MLFIPKIPASEHRCAEYRVTLNGIPAPVWAVRVSQYPINREWRGPRKLEQSEIAGYCPFVMDEPVEVCVEPLIRPIESVELRPRAFGVQPTVENGKITFTLEKPQYVTLQLNGQHSALHFLPNAPKEYDVQPGAGVRYYGPGVHEVGEVTLTSGETVYLDDEAVVYGGFFAMDAENIRILGRGVIDASMQPRPDYSDNHLSFHKPGDGLLCFTKCKNVIIDGPILRDANYWTIVTCVCEDVHISNVKQFGWRPNCDGIDLCNSRHCSIRNVFSRVYDDVIVIKGLKQPETYVETPEQAITDDILVEDCVVWCDWGHPLEIGLETAGDEMKNIVHRRCHVIKPNNEAIDVACAFRADVHDLLYEDCSVEYDAFNYQMNDDELYVINEQDDYWTPAMAIRIFEWSADPTGERGHARRVTFRNIDVWADKQPICLLHAHDDEHRIEDTAFENIRWNGKLLDTPEKLKLVEENAVDRTVVR